MDLRIILNRLEFEYKDLYRSLLTQPSIDTFIFDKYKGSLDFFESNILPHYFQNEGELSSIKNILDKHSRNYIYGKLMCKYISQFRKSLDKDEVSRFKLKVECELFDYQVPSKESSFKLIKSLERSIFKSNMR